MSDDNKNSDSFDLENFDFNSLNDGEPQAKSGDSAFDLDNPFGDDIVVTRDETNTSAESASIFDDSSVNGLAEESQEPGEEGDVPPIAAGEEPAPKKKGFLGGLFGGKKAKTPKEKASKEKAPKEKQAKEKQPKPQKEKKEKTPKDKEVAGSRPAVPRDWGTILCIAFSVFLFASLLAFNVATFLTGGKNLMLTLCFLGAFNIVGLVLVAVPVLFYKFPQERTLPNVMLGISVGAMFTGVLFCVVEFYRYDFVMTP